MSSTVIYRALLVVALLTAATSAATLLHVGGRGHEQVVDLTFPVAGAVEYRDDYAAKRGGGSRAHRGTDIFAPTGRAVHAAVGGKITWLPGRHPTAGYALHIRGTDGRLYAYYHLGPHRGSAAKAYATGLRTGSTVRRGQQIGFVGDSGNAAGGRPHLHFEIHDDRVIDPYGTRRLNPHPSLAAAVRRGDYPGGTALTASRSQRGGLLRLGDRGAAVSDWQAQLNRVRPSPIGVDGAFGPQTDRATRAFQRAAGIAVDGVVGPATRAAMPSAGPAAGGVLRLGDHGPPVRAWQAQLNHLRSPRIAVDGAFGPQTDRATREFQRSAGIVVDGVVGPATRAAARR